MAGNHRLVIHNNDQNVHKGISAEVGIVNCKSMAEYETRCCGAKIWLPILYYFGSTQALAAYSTVYCYFSKFLIRCALFFFL